VEAEELRQALDRSDARRLDLFWRGKTLGKLGSTGNAARGVAIGGVVTVFATDQLVLARRRRREIVARLAPAHDPRLCEHVADLEPAASEDSPVRTLVQLEAAVEPIAVSVEGVGIFHDELSHADEPRRRPRLVPFLRG